MLPFIDAHEATLALAVAPAWDRLVDLVGRSVLLGARGFPLREADPPHRLRLAGAHLFAAYELTFDLDAVGDGRTRVRASTRARFAPGPGRLYQAMVIGSGAHAWVVRRFLRALG